MTKIKGWRNKFTMSHETSASNRDESPKNLSAFCSNMLDEYLESEAQQISDRAAAFSLNLDNSVSYQLPAKSASYVKTLDSVLRHRNAVSKVLEGPSRPCPLSRKPLLSSSLRSQASHLTSPKPQSPAEPQSRSSVTHPDSSSRCSYSSNISQRLLPDQAEICITSAQRLGQDQVWPQKASNLSEDQIKLSFLETGALNQGLSRTQLTPERLSTALSAVLTNQTPPHQILKTPPLPPTDAGPECGQEFCRLGCVCSSLQHREREPVHCRRPECMFDCTCSNTMTNMEQTAQSLLGFSATKMWEPNVCDPDPDSLNVPKNKHLVPTKVPRHCAFNPPPLIREEDKGPVYRFLESKMTCARVRALNSQPPPVLTLETELSAANVRTKAATKPQILSHHVSNKRPLLISCKTEGQHSQGNAFSEKETRKQIQIRSLCQWKRDREMVLEGLCERMNLNRLRKRFFIGPYCIIPVAKVTLQKPSGSLITYRVQICKPTDVSNWEEEDNSDYDYNSDGSIDTEVEDELVEDPELWYGVTPFLRGTVPAGSLCARKRPIGYKATGLVEVNGKHYNYARLMLGNIGSLHPASRLAAHVTGRLPDPSRLSQTGSQNQGSAIKTDPAGSVPANAACPPAATEQTQKTTLQPPVEPLQTVKASASLGQTQNSLNPLYPVQVLIPVRHDLQNSSTSLPGSLTVSPSLKNPPFLGQSGTYSFRICPPSNQTVGAQKPPGVVLPGGFTLIELPKPGADGATQEAKPPPATETGSTAQKKEVASNLSHLAKEWVGFDTLSKAGKLLSSGSPEPGSSSGPISDEKMATEENSEADSRQTPSLESLDSSSEESSSDFSDDEEFDDYDEAVDIETVEEGKQRKVIAKMKEDAWENPHNTRSSTNDSGSSREPGSLAENKNSLNWRWNHKTIEKQRRSEQKVLLNKLQKTLRSPSRTSMFHLLSMAIKEIQVLTETSRCLKEEKEKLIKEQTVYVHKLSLESGKSEVLIQKKLKEIFERQKQREKDMKWKLVFSQMLQTKAALLQATAPTSHLQLLLLHQRDFEPPSQTQQPTAAQKKLQMLLTLLHPNKAVDLGSDQVSEQQSSSQAASLSGHAVTVAPSQTGSQHDESPSTESQEASGDPDPATLPYCLTKNQAPCSQNGPTSRSSAAIVLPPQLLSSLPLIRSKTGRLILPSSLKPIGQGFYTLMLMDSKQKAEEDEASSSANVQPSDGDSSKSLESNVFPPDQPTDLANKTVIEDKAGTSDSNPRPPGGTTPLGELDVHSQSVVAPLLDVNVSETKQDLDSGLIQPAAAARLRFNQVSHLLPPDDFKPDSSPPVGCCRSSMPMEIKSPTVTAGKQKETNKIDITTLLLESKSDKLTVETGKMEVWDTLNKSSNHAGYPAPAKRRRGRPPKKRLANSQTPSAKRTSSDDDSPVRFSICGFNSTKSEGEAYMSRPLTRGSLGKDFPSAKKRSWIDVEKELEPDMEYA